MFLFPQHYRHPVPDMRLYTDASGTIVFGEMVSGQVASPYAPKQRQRNQHRMAGTLLHSCSVCYMISPFFGKLSSSGAITYQ